MHCGLSNRNRSIVHNGWRYRSIALALFLIVQPWTTLPIEAADRNQARILRMLKGKNDGPRVVIMKSIRNDFQSRDLALPMVIASLQSLENDPIFIRAAKQGRPDLPDGVRMMIDYVGSIDRPESTDALVDLLDCGRISWTMAAIRALCKNRHHAAIDEVAALADSEFFESHYGFRFTLARGLINLNHPDSWDAVAKLFDRVDGQLAHRLEQEFQKVTVEDFRDDQQRFEAWRDAVGVGQPAPVPDDPLAKAVAILNQQDADAMPMPKQMGLQPSQSAASYGKERHLKPSHYYGINIYAKRLLFVIDRSGSMKKVYNGLSRMQRAKHELMTAINGLDEQCEFGILVFDSEVRSWREQLVAASDDNKREALRFVERLGAGSTTNTYAALRKSLAFDDQLEAVFLLTDGEPTTGMIINPSSILVDILSRNESNNITINAVAIAVEPLMSTFLRHLTEPSNGEYRDVK